MLIDLNNRLRFRKYPTLTQLTTGSNTMRSILSILILMLSGSVVLAGENWPQFLGPEGNGWSDAKGLPLKWSETENVKWKTAIHGRGWSSPVIWGNQIWLTTATEDGKFSTLYASIASRERFCTTSRCSRTTSRRPSRR